MDSQPPPRRSKRIAELASRSTLAPSPTTSALLNLPPELRIIIFEFALIVDGNIAVTTDTKTPALFATNRQVRSETIPIWYGKNEFRFVVNQCDASLVQKFDQQAVPPEQRDSFGTKVVFTLENEPNWSNLREWCRAVYRGSTVNVMALELSEEIEEDQSWVSIVAAAHLVCRDASEKKESWTQCEKTLDRLRRVAVFADRRWLEE